MKVRFCFLLYLLSVNFACAPRKQVLRIPEPEAVTPNRPSASGVSELGTAYIERYKQIAIDEMNKHGIPASIKLAQGLLESGQGTSRLAREANNHFGIKCAADWTGPRIFHDDDERNDCFRVYSSAEESFQDHSKFLLRTRYKNLFSLDQRDYKGWAHGLKEAGYATNPRYAELLIGLIERYNLHQYDLPGRSAAPVSPSVTPTHTTSSTAAAQRASSSSERKKSPMRIHEVRAGETLEAIALKYQVRVDQILQWNDLKSSSLSSGQLLLVSP